MPPLARCCQPCLGYLMIQGKCLHPAVSPCSQTSAISKMCEETPQLLSLALYLDENQETQVPRISSYRQANLEPGMKRQWQQQHARSSPYPVSITQNGLLREDISIPSAISLKAVADVLLLLHVHVVELVDWDRISRTRSAGRESARRTLWRALAGTQWRVHMGCARTRRHVWLAGPDRFGNVLGGASSRFLEVQEKLT